MGTWNVRRVWASSRVSGCPNERRAPDGVDRAAALAGAEAPASVAAQVLHRIARFRLNGKHLDVQFSDGSRWEARFGGGKEP